MIPVYFISGLGADATVFERLELDPQIEVNHLPWLVPKANEKMFDYAQRMIKDIQDPENSIIVGLSFGGVMAIEIARSIKVKHVILLSSIKNRSEMPLQLDMIGLLRLNRLIPASKLMHYHELVSWFFGVRPGREKNLFDRLLEQTDEALVDWSSEQILTWKGEHNIRNITHIHGTADTVFPIKRVKPDHVIKGGPHFMVYTHAKAVSKILNSVILSLSEN